MKRLIDYVEVNGVNTPTLDSVQKLEKMYYDQQKEIAELKEYVTHKEDCREWDGDDCGCGLQKILNKHS